ATLFLADWWNWYQAGETLNPDVHATADQYHLTQAVGGLTVAVESGVIANDAPAGTPDLSVLLVTSTTHGNLSLATDGSFTYSPDAGFYGSDHFSYLLADGLLSGGMATVELVVSESMLGDANRDGQVDSTDFDIWFAHRFQGPGLAWEDGDFNEDGYVDGRDFGIWNMNRFTSNNAAAALHGEPRAPLASGTSVVVAGIEVLNALPVNSVETSVGSISDLGNATSLIHEPDVGRRAYRDRGFSGRVRTLRRAELERTPSKWEDLKTPLSDQLD
ncbi:MAG: cadherin-like domain-containing protein, partial [Planctomycetales bacterium]|nr:cadherin-like domain-containing protein [Planctomycetales bacterium]